MNNRQRILAVLNYQDYDRLPIVHFGFDTNILIKWVDEGHLTAEEMEAACQGDASSGEHALAMQLGFDCSYHKVFQFDCGIRPLFEREVLEELPDGNRKVRTEYGVILMQNDRNVSIETHVGHLLEGRKEWEEHFLPRLHYSDERVNAGLVDCNGQTRRFDQGGEQFLATEDRDYHYILHCGSLYGVLRDCIGMENLCYLAADDEPLVDEMIEVYADLLCRCVEKALGGGAKFDIAHFWEDICFKNGPLVNPSFFAEHVGPHYKRITDIVHKHGINLVSLDCDGMIDALIPTWIENGVNVMFPVEVGTWNASIEPWRKEYGRRLLGVGGMNKRVFAQDYAAVDKEVERLKALVDLGGYLPCMDHRVPGDAEWDNVKYYCEAMRKAFPG